MESEAFSFEPNQQYGPSGDLAWLAEAEGFFESHSLGPCQPMDIDDFFLDLDNQNGLSGDLNQSTGMDNIFESDSLQSCQPMEVDIFSLEIDEQNNTLDDLTQPAGMNNFFELGSLELCQYMGAELKPGKTEPPLDIFDNVDSLARFLGDQTIPWPPLAGLSIDGPGFHERNFDFGQEQAERSNSNFDPVLGWQLDHNQPFSVDKLYNDLETDDPSIKRPEGEAPSPNKFSTHPFLDHGGICNQLKSGPGILQQSENPDLELGLHKPRAERTYISAEARSILEVSFASNPYPRDGDFAKLEASTGLPARTVRNWFKNTRSRKDTADSTLHNAVNEVQHASPVTYLSAANLERLNRAAPGSSDDPFKSIPITSCAQDSIPSLHVSVGAEMRYQSAISRKSSSPIPTQSLPIPTPPSLIPIPSPPIPIPSPPTPLPSPPIPIPSPRRPHSNAGSSSSFGSANSIGSVRSVDSRGSRRGRKVWAAAPNVEPNSLHRLFCTWPGCTARFRYHYAWKRHEEASHYCPYRWVCCWSLDVLEGITNCFLCQTNDITSQHFIDKHFFACLEKPVIERTFFRQDQLVQHIKGVHADDRRLATVPSAVHISWKSENLLSGGSTLKCFFCGRPFLTWEARTEHVYNHMQAGAIKPDWWTERLPIPRVSESLSVAAFKPE
ncbi:hypothetical protein BKA66DRAFT_254787 [Pyrenochaeta sp. MPI-SDFR-AT-0127]|nr:hypothetical protein BKA66DRAFT_254787 [Pyrenochaeta sp. MPI-SDFR-AT-0127]